MDKEKRPQKKTSPREDRLGEALRKNLLKRKQQVRERQAEKEEPKKEEIGSN